MVCKTVLRFRIDDKTTRYVYVTSASYIARLCAEHSARYIGWSYIKSRFVLSTSSYVDQSCSLIAKGGGSKVRKKEG